MMLSSSTEPQPVHTASPRAASNSMSVPPQPRQTRPVMVEPRGPTGPPAAQQSALRPRPSARKARRAASVCAALSRGRRRHACRFVAADSPSACGPRCLQRPRPRDR
ncbi:mCG147617 [Mus musculus]|nr:mCG147617 [Mus musculus]